MAETLTIRTSSSTDVIKVVERGPQGPTGPQGPAGEGGGEDVEVYTVTGATFTVPAVRSARVLIDTNVASNITITLNAASPQNLDRVEVILIRTQGAFKATVVTGGFGNFDLYGTQKATFVYGSNIGPSRWVKTFDNVFQEAVPTLVNDFGQPGSIAYANNFLYICVANNPEVVWRRVALSAWTTP
jgi:hypothetical protein